MWNTMTQNRLVSERDKAKAHMLHITKLYGIKSRIDYRPPNKPKHAIKNLGLKTIRKDRKSQIDYENRLLLKKILTIDLNHGKLSPKRSDSRPFTATGTLTKEQRFKTQERICDENRAIASKLQHTRSNYNNFKWNLDFYHSEYMAYNISKNTFNKNPYYLGGVMEDNRPFSLNELSSLLRYRTLDERPRRDLQTAGSPRNKNESPSPGTRPTTGHRPQTVPNKNAMKYAQFNYGKGPFTKTLQPSQSHKVIRGEEAGKRRKYIRNSASEKELREGGKNNENEGKDKEIGENKESEKETQNPKENEDRAPRERRESAKQRGKEKNRSGKKDSNKGKKEGEENNGSIGNTGETEEIDKEKKEETKAGMDKTVQAAPKDSKKAIGAKEDKKVMEKTVKAAPKEDKGGKKTTKEGPKENKKGMDRREEGGNERNKKESKESNDNIKEELDLLNKDEKERADEEFEPYSPTEDEAELEEEKKVQELKKSSRDSKPKGEKEKAMAEKSREEQSKSKLTEQWDDEEEKKMQSIEKPQVLENSVENQSKSRVIEQWDEEEENKMQFITHPQTLHI